MYTRSSVVERTKMRQSRSMRRLPSTVAAGAVYRHEYRLKPVVPFEGVSHVHWTGGGVEGGGAGGGGETGGETGGGETGGGGWSRLSITC